MKRWLLVPMAVALPVLAVFCYYIFAVPEVVRQTDSYLTEVRLRDLEVQVRSLGTLEARNSHMISSQIKGPGAKIIYLAENGTFVAEGEILVRFDAKPFEDAVAELASRKDTLTAAVEAARQLVEWEKNEALQRIVSAEYQLRVAQLDLQRLIEGEGPLKLAQYKDELDKTDLELKHHLAYEADLQQLQEEGIASPAELERTRENIKILQGKHQSAKRQYDSYERYVLPVMIESYREKVKTTELSIEQVKQSSVHKIANAQATFEQTKGKLKAVQLALQKASKELKKTVIKAPFDGLIIHYETYRNGELRTPREGDTVIINQPVMYFPDISNLVAKSRIREIDLHRIRVKQLATVYVDAYPEERFEAELAFIGALAKRQPNSPYHEKYFQVVFSLKTDDERLRPGMSVRIVIHVAAEKEIPTIPIHSVYQDQGGEFCYLWNGVMYEKRYVTTGLQNEDFVEIKAGLSLGDKVSQVQPDQSL